MSMPFDSKDFITIAFAAPILAAAGWDLAFYKIPNVIPAFVAALFVFCAFMWGVEVNWLSHAGAALAVLAVGLGLFAFRVFGGGDIKLLAAVALWLGLTNDLAAYLLVVALLGGALAVALVMVRSAVATWGAPWLVSVPRLIQPGAPVPYGVAIAAVALWIAPRASLFIFMR
jgi:prepilin peptidase CpaA